MEYRDVLQFWFEELGPDDWFEVKPDVDESIRTRFSELHERAVAGETKDWRTTPEGALAEIIVLDQFSRNMFRGSPMSFAYDEQALALAREAIERGFDQELPKEQRAFMYLPYMHSESPEVHVEAERLFESLGSEKHLKYERLHKRIIDRFGRYPHRNEILGRETTPEEQEFLENEENASF